MTRRDAKIAARRLRRLPWMIEVELRHPLPARESDLMRRPWRGYSVVAYHRGSGSLHVTSARLHGRSNAALLSALGVRL